ncbi:SpoIID/LytB domain-containing protein, partial [Dehalococcoidia bacterium]|nr:SpoIID/LytB domain-containing protein [Dehalococcoidia bacterium]
MFSRLIRREKTTGGALKIALVFLMVGTMVAGLPGVNRAFASASPLAELTIAASAAEQPVVPVVDIPSTIRVLMDDGSIVQMDIEEYLRGVVYEEMGPEWVMARGLNEDQVLEALKAQAVAARTYAIARVLGAIWNPHAGAGADVCTTTCCQVWSDKSHWLSDKAVQQTRNVVITYNGEIIQAFYFAHCDGKTRTPRTAHPNPWLEDLPYLLSVECICGQDSMHGHGVGMCQWGAVAMAKHGYRYEDILRHYFTGVEVVLAGDNGEVVTILDPNLEEAIREELGIAADVNIYRSDLEGLTELRAQGRGISDLTGLEYAVNLTDLRLGWNQISDLSPLSNLTNLTWLWLEGNQISDL